MNAGNDIRVAMLGGVNDFASGSKKNKCCRMDKSGVTTELLHSVYTPIMLSEPHL
jgi:hypothetical protein